VDDSTLARRLETLAAELERLAVKYAHFYRQRAHIGARWMVPAILRRVASEIRGIAKDADEEVEDREANRALERLYAATHPSHRPRTPITPEQVDGLLEYVVPLCREIKKRYRGLKRLGLRDEILRRLADERFEDWPTLPVELLSKMAPWTNGPVKMASIFLHERGMPAAASTIFRRKSRLK
jgi:hypothetical protein